MNFIYSIPIESLFFVGAILCCVALIRDEIKINRFKVMLRKVYGDAYLYGSGFIYMKPQPEHISYRDIFDPENFACTSISISREQFEEMYPPMEST